jgi:NhaP-type Na+/H+ or K+/H+ antiporter
MAPQNIAFSLQGMAAYGISLLFAICTVVDGSSSTVSDNVDYGITIAYDCACLVSANSSVHKATTTCTGPVNGAGISHCALPTPHGAGHSVGAMTEVYLLIVSLICGLLFRQEKRLPYTVLLLMGGFVFQGFFSIVVVPLNPETGKFLEIVRDLDPHVILFVFLPALVFESAFYTNPHVFIKQLPNVLLLAFPGVILATFLTSLFAQHVMYGTQCSNDNPLCVGEPWDFTTAMLFGSIMSATDPVAVVGLLKELGAPEQLGVLIEGESLLNDGSAIVLFTIFSQNMFAKYDPHIAPKIDPSTQQAVVYGVDTGFGQFVYMAIGGLLIGTIVASISLKFLHCLHDNALSEVAITLVAAYGPFLLAESFAASGVLACVGAGMTMALYRTEVSASVSEFMNETWELLSYLLNTVLFVVTGIFVAYSARESPGIRWGHELPMAIALYFVLMVVRGVVIAVFFPVLRKCGYGLNVPSALICWWGGLRGAVGLALAMIVRGMTKNSTNPQMVLVGDRVLFHTSFIAAMTLIVNGTTTAPLLRYLKLNKVSRASERMKLRATVRLDHVMKEEAKALHRPEFSTFFKHMTEKEWTQVWYYLPIHSEAVYVLRTQAKKRPIERVKARDIPVRFRQRWQTYEKMWKNDKVTSRVREVLQSNACTEVRHALEGTLPRALSHSISDPHVEMEEARRRFIAAAKGLYHVQKAKGFISLVTVYNHLIEAEDIALDSPDCPMDQFHSLLRDAVEMSGFVQCLQSFCGNGPFRCLTRYLVQHHVTMAFELLTNFIYVHEHVIGHLQTNKTHDGVLGNKEALQLSFENRKVLDEAHAYLKDLQLLFPEILQFAGTKMAARVMLNAERETTIEEFEEGELMAGEMQAMLKETILSITKLRLDDESLTICLDEKDNFMDVRTLIQKNNRARPYRSLAVVSNDVILRLVSIATEIFYEHGAVVYTAGSLPEHIHYVGRGIAIICTVVDGNHEDDDTARQALKKIQRAHLTAVQKTRLKRESTSRCLSLKQTKKLPNADLSVKWKLSEDLLAEEIKALDDLAVYASVYRKSDVLQANSIELSKLPRPTVSNEHDQQDTRVASVDDRRHADQHHMHATHSAPLLLAKDSTGTRQSKLEQIAAECGASVNGKGHVEEHDLKVFMNIQQLFDYGTVSILRSVEFGDLCGCVELLSSHSQYKATMEAESSMAIVSFPKSAISDLCKEDNTFKLVLWKEAAIELIQTNGVFPDTELFRSRAWKDVVVACRESHIQELTPPQTIDLRAGYGVYVLDGDVTLDDNGSVCSFRRNMYIPASTEQKRSICSTLDDGAVVMIMPPAALKKMRLMCPPYTADGVKNKNAIKLKTILDSMVYSTKEEKLGILESALDDLSLAGIDRLVNEEPDLTETEEDKEFVEAILRRKRAYIESRFDAQAKKTKHFSTEQEKKKLERNATCELISLEHSASLASLATPERVRAGSEGINTK